MDGGAGEAGAALSHVGSRRRQCEWWLGLREDEGLAPR